MHSVGTTILPSDPTRMSVPPVVARRFVPLPCPSLRLLPSKIHHVQSICYMKPFILLEKNCGNFEVPMWQWHKMKEKHWFIYFDLFLWCLENDSSVFQSWRVYVIGVQTPPSRPRAFNLVGKHVHPLLICSSLSTAQLPKVDIKQLQQTQA